MLAALPVLAAIAFCGYLAADVALHLRGGGLDPLRHALSHYATGRDRRLARLAADANILGLATLLASLAAAAGVPAVPGGSLATVAVMAATRVGTRLLPIDAPDRPATSRGRAHVLLAMANFAVSVAAVQALSRLLASASGWHRLSPVLTALAGLALPLVLVVGAAYLVRPLRRVFGLAERLFALDLHAWLLLVALQASVHALRLG